MKQSELLEAELIEEVETIDVSSKDKRIDVLLSIGLKFDGSDFKYADIHINHLDVLTYSDEKFSELIAKLPDIVADRRLKGWDSLEIENIIDVDISKAVVVTQKPIIAYDTLEAISKNVSDKIQSLNIESLEPTEDNLSLIKRTRADLTKDFNDLENQRKMVKEIIMKDYNIFEDDYKKLISSLFKNADDQLKSLASTVDDKILSVKIDGIVQYFKEVNEHDFIKFDDLGLKIIKSKSDKSIKTEIDEYLSGIKKSLATIETLTNKERVLAKFKMCRDLNRSISETNIEVQYEEQIKAQNEERECQAEERRLMDIEAKRKADEANQQCNESIEAEVMESAQQFIPEPVCEPVYMVGTLETEPRPTIEEETVYKCTFSVFATKSQLKQCKEFFAQIGVKYE